MSESPMPPDPLDASLLAQLLQGGNWKFPDPVVLRETTSTNADAVQLGKNGAPSWSLVLADSQTAGRGRLTRTWESPPNSAILMSALIRIDSATASAALGWLPLIAGLSVAEALRPRNVPVMVKWPNDIVIDGDAFDGTAGPRKLGGILCEAVAGFVVVGVGVNVALTHAQLPVPIATSLFLEQPNSADSRESVIADIAHRLRDRWEKWSQSGFDAMGAGIIDAYTEQCLTLGKRVRVVRPGHDDLIAEARSIDNGGRLIVRRGSDEVAVSAGDIVHLRHANGE